MVLELLYPSDITCNIDKSQGCWVFLAFATQSNEVCSTYVCKLILLPCRYGKTDSRNVVLLCVYKA